MENNGYKIEFKLGKDDSVDLRWMKDVKRLVECPCGIEE